MNYDFIYESIKPFTICSKERTYATIRSVEYCVLNNVIGDFVECGVYSGGQIMAMIMALMFLNKNDRDIYLYDTFDGMPMPEKWETNRFKKTMAIDKFNKIKSKGKKWTYAPLETVKKNVESLGYGGKIFFIKGMVEDTLKNHNHKKIALLRLDTDFYSSTKAEMECLYPYVTKSGILIVDDYGHWNGAKKAVDEYFASTNLSVNIEFNDKTGITVTRS